MKILVTGAAGFIGYHTASRLIARGDDVVGADIVNDYYDPALKEARIAHLTESAGGRAGRNTGKFVFNRLNLADRDATAKLFDGHRFDRVIHLAAQAGVRYSLANPYAYVESNITAFTVILEMCRAHKTPHLTYASTSSVYGADTAMPFSEHVGGDHPLQFYAATKRANELMAHSYSHLFGLPTTGLRFFTVYGPWGRPDMAFFSFTRNILQGKPIQVFNNGHHSRDFTYVDDIVEGVIRISDKPAEANAAWDGMQPDPATSAAPFRIFNIGNGTPVPLMEYIKAIEDAAGKKAIIEFLPMQPGDVPDTHADVRELHAYTGYHPKTQVRDGIAQFVKWYRGYYEV
jgi:UDP-glucuronate 4-epimerase